MDNTDSNVAKSKTFNLIHYNSLNILNVKRDSLLVSKPSRLKL